MASLMPLNIKMLSTLTRLKQNAMKMIQDVKLCMKNSANIAIVSKKLLKTKNRGTLKTKYLKVLVISRKLGRSLINLEAKVKIHKAMFFSKWGTCSPTENHS